MTGETYGLLLPTPPYFLIGMALLALLAGGSALQEVLRQAFLTGHKPNLNQMSIPYLAICAGFLVMLASCLQIVGFSALGGYLVAVPFVVSFAAFVWWRLLAEI